VRAERERSEQTMEIERKYRLQRPPPPERLGEGKAIAQGYLPVAGLRIRRKGSVCFLTLKSEGDLAREEWEVELPEWAFERLWPETEGRRLEKRRYLVPHGRFALPARAEDAEEVTRDARYRNAVLAARGLPERA